MRRLHTSSTTATWRKPAVTPAPTLGDVTEALGAYQARHAFHPDPIAGLPEIFENPRRALRGMRSGGIVPDSRAKRAAALPMMSRSTLSWRFSRRSRANAASDGSPLVPQRSMTVICPRTPTCNQLADSLHPSGATAQRICGASRSGANRPRPRICQNKTSDSREFPLQRTWRIAAMVIFSAMSDAAIGA